MLSFRPSRQNLAKATIHADGRFTVAVPSPLVAAHVQLRAWPVRSSSRHIDHMTFLVLASVSNVRSRNDHTKMRFSDDGVHGRSGDVGIGRLAGLGLNRSSCAKRADIEAPMSGRISARLALQLLLLRASESMGNHDSNVVGAGRVG